MAALSLCFSLSLGLSPTDSLLLCFWGCRSVQGPSGLRLRCRRQGYSALVRCSASPVAALAPAAGLSFIELRPVSRCRLRPSSLHVAALYLSSRSPAQARVRSPSVRRRRSPYVQCPESCGESAIDFRVVTLSVSNGSKFPGQFWVRFQPGTEPLQRVPTQQPLLKRQHFLLQLNI